MTVHVHENDISYSPKNYQDGGSDEEGSAGDGEEDPIVSEPRPEDATVLLGPGHAHYIPHREWLAREAQVYFIPSTVPGMWH